jgi:superoxide dismutase, Fe-Mn family
MYEGKKFDHLLGTPGFSDDLLKNHFSLYNGYVQNFNKLMEELAELREQQREATPEYAEVKRRFGWEFNGIRLHEYYFGNLKNGGSQISRESELYKKIENDFGSYEKWENDFKSTGAMRGIGWVILYFDSVGNRLFNVWVNEHDAGHLAGASVILVLDVFEHAFMQDYGLKKADYIQAFFNALDWEEAQHRFNLMAYQEISV